MLKQRVVTALVSVPFLVATVWYDDSFPWFTILVVIWGSLATLEFYRLVKTQQETTSVMAVGGGKDDVNK